MTDYEKFSTQITDSLTLNDHHYQDVQCIVEGKLRDRWDNLCGQKTRNGVIDETRIKNAVTVAVEKLLSSSVKNVLNTATYYRKKYNLAI